MHSQPKISRFVQFFTAFVLPFGVAYLALSPVAHSAPAPLKTSFEGRFDMGRLYKIRVGRKGTSPSSPLVGTIETRKGVPVAECKMKHFERARALEPTALSFECQNTTLSPLASAMTLLWKGNAVRIQFGTWIGGYEHAAVEVDRDLFAPPRVLARR